MDQIVITTVGGAFTGLVSLLIWLVKRHQVATEQLEARLRTESDGREAATKAAHTLQLAEERLRWAESLDRSNLQLEKSNEALGEVISLLMSRAKTGTTYPPSPGPSVKKQSVETSPSSPRVPELDPHSGGS